MTTITKLITVVVITAGVGAGTVPVASAAAPTRPRSIDRVRVAPSVPDVARPYGRGLPVV